MKNQEAEKVSISQEAIKKIVCNEPGLSTPSQEIENLRKVGLLNKTVLVIV